MLALFQRSHLPVEVLAKEEDDGDRVVALYALAQQQPCVLVVNAMVLLDHFPTPAYFVSGIVSLAVGEEVEQEQFLDHLLTLGYEAASVCEQPGTFARRGGIVDFFSPNYPRPLRVEWFDDEIDSLRFFSAETQKSEQNVENATVIPSHDTFFTDAVRQTLVTRIEGELAETAARAGEDVQKQLQERLAHVGEESDASILSYYAYLAPEFQATLFDHLPEDALLCVDETEVVDSTLQTKHEAILSQLGDLFTYGYILPSKIESLPALDVLEDLLARPKSVFLSEVRAQHRLFHEEKVRYYPITANPLKAYPVNRFIADIQEYVRDGYTLIFYNSQEEPLTLLKNLLDEYSLQYHQVQKLADADPYQEIVLLAEDYTFACAFSVDRCIFMDANVFNVQTEKEQPKKPQKKRSGLVIEDLQVGDYIVHEHHGIGLYLGIEHIVREGVEKDYILIQYRGADRLFVPIDQMHLVENTLARKASGQRSTSSAPATGANRRNASRNPSRTWPSSCLRSTPSVRSSQASPLRQTTSCSMPSRPPSRMLRPTISSKPSGKSRPTWKTTRHGPSCLRRCRLRQTEVALRAAFKAVANGKQVAVLVPTTILAMQHYETFTARMKDFGVEIAQLTRFCTTKEQNRIF